MNTSAQHIRTLWAAAAVPAFLAIPLSAQAFYLQENLVSDLPGVAANTDPNLANPWGMASSPTSPIWVSDNHTGVMTIYNASGITQRPPVTVPPPAGGTPPAAPTGQVFNSTDSFNLSTGGKSLFITATEDGTVAAWNAAQGNTAQRVVDNSASGAVYKGITIGSTGGKNYLYATNFSAGTVDVFNSNFGMASLVGKFSDPNIPQGYAPFNIQNIDGHLYVTYAQQDAAKHDDVAGAGHGFIDIFNANGKLEKRLITQGALNSPWGLAVAPKDFGQFAKDLLVGNFGDGTINAFNPHSGKFDGTLTDAAGKPISIEGLWGLKFGNGGNGGALDQLFFTAGISGGDGGAKEDHGLFGDLKFVSQGQVPEPSGLALLVIALAAALGVRRLPGSRRDS